MLRKSIILDIAILQELPEYERLYGNPKSTPRPNSGASR